MSKTVHTLYTFLLTQTDSDKKVPLERCDDIEDPWGYIDYNIQEPIDDDMCVEFSLPPLIPVQDLKISGSSEEIIEKMIRLVIANLALADSNSCGVDYETRIKELESLFLKEK